jgi:uncharacterized protein YegL
MNTEILFILDRSGSMESMRQAAIDGFNNFLRDQQAAPDSARMTLLQFDDQIEIPINAVPLPEVLPLDHETFIPRGSTALLDAIGHGIDSLGKRLAAMPEDQRPQSVIVAILTDGEENSSRRFTWTHIADRIAHQRKKYDWDFFFLGAGQDAIATAAKMNIGALNSAFYAADADGMHSAKAALSRKVISSRAMKHGYATEEDKADYGRPTQDIVEEEKGKYRNNPDPDQ